MPDLILHTGDVFETYRPSYEDIQLGIDMLRELSDLAPVVVLCGNHDSPALFRLFQKLLGGDRRLIFVDQARRPEDGGILDFPAKDGDRIRLAPLPFVSNRGVDRFLDPSLWMSRYSDKIDVYERELERGLLSGFDERRDVLIFGAHLYVSGAITSRSERPLHISDAYMAKLESTPPVTYAAFGHIHRPQKLPTRRTLARYAGSPIPIDFGEEGETKSIVLVEARPGGAPSVSTVDLSGGRALRTLRGSAAELVMLADQVDDALCNVTLVSDGPEPNASSIVAAMFTRAAILRVANEYPGARLRPIEDDGDREAEEDLTSMFRAFLTESATTGADAESVLEVFTRVLTALESAESVEIAELKDDIEVLRV